MYPSSLPLVLQASSFVLLQTVIEVVGEVSDICARRQSL